ncbi:MAG: hypothetical protein CM15mP84_10640 [Cellvibrionales bacterium]|nr:MAG: hypothetical protein CM15mP84_10640 [Cellvibrionales bacterium]
MLCLRFFNGDFLKNKHRSPHRTRLKTSIRRKSSRRDLHLGRTVHAQRLLHLCTDPSQTSLEDPADDFPSLKTLTSGNTASRLSAVSN